MQRENVMENVREFQCKEKKSGESQGILKNKKSQERSGNFVV